MKEYNARMSRASSSKAAKSPPDHLKRHMRIYFPTETTVASSRGGRGVSASRRLASILAISPPLPSPASPDGLVPIGRDGVYGTTNANKTPGSGHHLPPGQVVATAQLPHRPRSRLREHSAWYADAQQADIRAPGGFI